MDHYLSDLGDISSLVNQPARSVIVSHRNPDGDAIGSCLGLKHFLEFKGHHVEVIFPSEYPVSFEFLPGANTILITDIEPDKVTQSIQSAEIIWALDFNALDRIDKTGDLIKHSTATKIMIDHHIDPEPFMSLMISRTSASSTCELVYDLIMEGWGKNSMHPMIGECLMVGILTDTGSLSYSISSELMRKVADLLDMGVDYIDLQQRIFNAAEEKHIRLLGHALANRMRIFPSQKVGLIFLNKQDFVDYNIQRGDTEGIVNQLLKMKLVEIAVFITEQPNIIKFSFRSKGDISVADICRKHFNGGGHKNASGGYLHTSLNMAIQKVYEVLKLGTVIP
jgi:phosphoesterase RecJ-like protein